MHTTQQLQEIMAAALSVPVSSITDELEYQGIPEWDSVSHIYLITELEAAYNISIDTEDVLEMSSVPKVKAVLKKHNIAIN
ncbi:acyl carrier protein [Chitinophaga japonensis]|uniref:Acyl carrier protein n=1 Tax=Chitinophaga japonensis TaxID=104662 RepID=A0A562SZL7_CHIJA|nr:acyl carrier protein [Chitinophaga japonensis]TWI86729.1 acyl carrier protein [Chitinophaga japonensis]